MYVSKVLFPNEFVHKQVYVGEETVYGSSPDMGSRTRVLFSAKHAQN
jgi:hypothetical protein